MIRPSEDLQIGPSECEIESCPAPVYQRGRYCAKHAKRFQRGTTAVDAELVERHYLTLKERVQHLAIALVQAESDADYERAWDALEKALTTWADQLRGRRGGQARAQALSAEARRASALHAIRARWARARAIRAGT